MVSMTADTLYDRLVMKIRRSGYKGALYKWCMAAGLSRSYLSKMHTSCKQGGHPSMDSETVKKFASALEMSVGEVLGVEVGNDNRYPSQALAIQNALDLGISVAAIEMGRSATPKTDPGWLWWFKRFEAAEVLLSVDRPSSVLRTGDRTD